MCGASDCQTCYPGNHENETCANCEEVYDECTCDEFIPMDEDDYDDDDDDGYDQDYEDRMADEAADRWERSQDRY